MLHEPHACARNSRSGSQLLSPRDINHNIDEHQRNMQNIFMRRREKLGLKGISSEDFASIYWRTCVYVLLRDYWLMRAVPVCLDLNLMLPILYTYIFHVYIVYILCIACSVFMVKYTETTFHPIYILLLKIVCQIIIYLDQYICKYIYIDIKIYI